MKNVIILMTALIPTTGHRDIIKFAADMPDTQVYVLINGRSFEPYHSLHRWNDIHQEFKHYYNVTIDHDVNDSAPQNPEDMPGIDFWNWWKNTINTKFPRVEKWDYVVASEPYGKQVAEVLEADFMPYDISRSNNPITGTEVRKDMWNNWESIITHTRVRFQQKAVIFGQESVGKTTVSKMAAEKLRAQWLPEWARPYLEAVGSDLTDDKMHNIVMGQYSITKTAYQEAKTPSVVSDTDLYSTIGYYRIGNFADNKKLYELASYTKGDIYYIMPDDIPFVEDPLRYGGNQRESTFEFWVDICKEFSLNYVIVPSGTAIEKSDFIANDITQRFRKNTLSIQSFERE